MVYVERVVSFLISSLLQILLITLVYKLAWPILNFSTQPGLLNIGAQPEEVE